MNVSADQVLKAICAGVSWVSLAKITSKAEANVKKTDSGSSQLWMPTVVYHPHTLLFLRSYMDCLCEEVNDTLQEVGQMSIATLSKNFGLPNDFLVEVRMYKCHYSGTPHFCTVLVTKILITKILIVHCPSCVNKFSPVAYCLYSTGYP